ncbi:MAG: AAA family ATPase, partial [Lachnospiraceae bacterium]|nr:AAA family ATPase [Lachnospiraceae bacterium]
MHLKSVEIQGFKSFAHKTRFDFMGGITGIVGPNGSGKSNVADAVRWVFGEQSAKQLRGSNMQDVIFAGTEIRRPMSYASVSITLDNADRALLTDADEVMVTRRVYRSGESEYIINGNQCRLRDINELFYDTGIGKEGYSIIGQGQVDKILSGKADDRRELFDEAAGIMKFKKRKAAAMRKLENERANMVRVTDILTELEKQAGPLKRQSEVARQYLKLRETQKIYDVTAFLLDSDTNSELLRKSAEDLSIVDHNLEENTAKLEQLKNQYADVEASLAKLDADTEEVRDRLMEAGSDRTRLEGEIRVLNEKIASETGSQALLSERAAALRASSEGKAAEMERTSRELSEGLGKAAGMEAELQTLQADLRGFNEKVALYRGTIEERHGQTIDIMNEKSAAGARLAEIETLLSGNASRTEEYEKRLREIVGRAKENREQLASKESEASEIRVSAAALEESVSSLEEE